MTAARKQAITASLLGAGRYLGETKKESIKFKWIEEVASVSRGLVFTGPYVICPTAAEKSS